MNLILNLLNIKGYLSVHVRRDTNLGYKDKCILSNLRCMSLDLNEYQWWPGLLVQGAQPRLLQTGIAALQIFALGTRHSVAQVPVPSILL
jgi:hypothetical protein